MRAEVRIPGAFMLWAPFSGAVHGTVGLSKRDAETRLADRKANGENFAGEFIRPVRLQVTVQPDGGVTGYLVHGPKLERGR